ncbi:hypothetical protein GCM10009678_55590 [Actinomadura kijaniata]|uniref:Uncharacterized protein n=1 Tax=Actinomadura namibiensis TaxID=182080 RepID=A0A7W3LLA7_ACTNM|nr:hypothetical protein [Actinomadura namibiensis]MBA8950224.1 hypothetical protein [Actinomadura namibiensis]
MSEQNPPFTARDLLARHRTIAGLRALADFLEANPNVPVNRHGVRYYVHSDRDRPDACGRAFVDRVAALLDVPVRDDTDQGGHYVATRDFGDVLFEVVHIPQRARTLHDAQWSYADNITLDDQGGRAA